MIKSVQVSFIIGLYISLLFASPGFFEENRQSRKAPQFDKVKTLPPLTGPADITFTADFSDTVNLVLSSIFGNNSNGWIRKGTAENDKAVEHLKKVNISYLRLPGGSWSDQWFWDGYEPDDIKEYVTTGNLDPRTFAEQGNSWILSTDEQVELARQIGAKPQIVVNFAYSRYSSSPDPVAKAAHHAAEFVRHVNDTLKAGVKYWEVGNENYGKWESGYVVKGDTITGTEYGKTFCVFADSMKAADPSIKIGAVVATEDGEKGEGFNWWNRGVLPEVQDHADYLILHEYFTWDNNGNIDIPVKVMLDSLCRIKGNMERLEEMVEQYTDKPAGHFPIVMTEFNCRAGRKNIAHVSGIFITMVLGEAIHAGYGLCNLWDIANGWKGPPGGDHGMLGRNEPVAEDGTPHPSFYSYYYMTRMFGDVMVQSTPEESQGVRAYFSQFAGGEAGVVLVNRSAQRQAVELKMSGFDTDDTCRWFSITAAHPESTAISINGTAGSPYGPLNYEEIAPYERAFTGSPIFEAEPYSINFMIVESKESNAINNHNTSGKASHGKLVVNSFSGIIIWKGSEPVLSRIVNLRGRVATKKLLKPGRNELTINSLGAGVYWIITDKGKESAIILKK